MSRRVAGAVLIALGWGCTSPSPGGDAVPSAPAVVVGAVAPIAMDPFPETPLGRAAQRGLAILDATRDSLPAQAGNALRCTSCHLDGGRRPHAMPWVGVTARYPQYRSRAGAVLTVEDRVQECIERSLAGQRLPNDDPRLRAILAYFAHLSRGVPVGSRVPGQGVDSATASPPDLRRGQQVYATQCARCHGSDGLGLPGLPPVWGPHSYTIAAGMARVQMAAAFIKRNMPFDAPGSLTDQQAVDVAAYINAQSRPDFAPKLGDWPNGDAPPDVPFRPRSMEPSGR